MTLFWSGHTPKKSGDPVDLANIKLPGPTALSTGRKERIVDEDKLGCSFTGCEKTAEFHIYDNRKCSASQLPVDACTEHVGSLIESVFPPTPEGTWMVASIVYTPKGDPEGWLSIKAAQKLHVCRVCQEKAAPKKRPNGTLNPFWYGHGHEHAHEDCLTPEALARMHRKIAETGPHRGD